MMMGPRSRSGLRGRWWTIMSVTFAVLFAVLAVFGVRSDIRGANRQGNLGTFTATHQECRASCDWRGSFVSDDGRVREPDTAYEGTITHRGQQARGYYVGTLTIYPGGGHPWVQSIVLGVVMVLAFMAGPLLGILLRRRTRRGGTPPRVQAQQ